MPYDFLGSLALVVALGLTHGLDPDHVAMARLLKKFSRVVSFALFHTAGFLIIALPLAFVVLHFSYAGKAIETGAYAVGLAVSSVLLFSAVTGREMEVEPRGQGLMQGALVLTPSKVVSLSLAVASGEVVYSLAILLAFVASSFLSLLLLSAVNLVPKNVERPFNVAVSLASIGYSAYGLLTAV